MATMMKPRPATRPRPTLDSVTTKTKALPNRLLLHAVQKWGKTSFGAMAPNPIFLCTRGEDGLDTLIKSGQLPETAHFPDPFETWNELMMGLDELYLMDHPYKTVVVDTVNGAERLGVEHVVETEFGGKFENFDAYGRGQKFMPTQIIAFTSALDKLRHKGMAVILLAHSQVKMFNNPEGANYDRWEPVLAKETWAIIDRWVDMILFGNFETFAEKERKNDVKVKATGGTNRIIHTIRTAAYDAGNRYGLPEEIECGSSPKEAWANFIAALHPNRK